MTSPMLPWGSGVRASLQLAAQEQNGRLAEAQTTRLHVGHLTRNVREDHVREIFGTFGTLKVGGLIISFSLGSF